MPETSAPTNGSGERRERRGAIRPGALLDPVVIATSVWRLRFLILLCMLLGVAGAVAVAMTTPKVYHATTQILMDPRDLKVVANEVTPNGLPSEATLALIESQTSVILSSNVLSRVVEKTRLDADPEFNGRMKTGLGTLLPAVFTEIGARPDEELRSRDQRVLETLRRKMSVSRETKSFVINLTVESFDPQKAALLANTAAEVFIAEQGRVQSDTARRATDSLSSRLSELRRSVVEAEGRVEAYKSENALIGVGGRLVDDDYIVRINDQLAKARGDITALRVRADSMRRASVEDVVRGTLPEELSSAGLLRLRQSYSDLAQQAAILATKLGPRHPQRLASEGALGAAKQAIAGELSRIVAAAQTELARAAETERDLTAQIQELKEKQVETSGSFVKLRELEREVDASRAVYEAFLLRARETSEQESLNTANVRVISDATAPLEPAGLSRKIVVLAGAVVGLAMGVGLAALIAILRLFAQSGALAATASAAARADVPSRRVEEEPALVPGVVYHAPSPDAPPATDPVSVASMPVPPGAVPMAGTELRSSIHAEAHALRRPSRDAQLEVVDEASAAASETSAPTGERLLLRERLRALSAGRASTLDEAPASPEATHLAQDIASIRAAIADIRRRKATSTRLA